ncbi:MAG: TonB-dependent receptor [Balneolaceae bacterium]|nr:TonB-dependent receptor [Balneolaceae bacterium]
MEQSRADHRGARVARRRLRRRPQKWPTPTLPPAINATYELTGATNLRAAYSRTLARPEFREIANFNFADYFGGQRIYGNPDLKRTRITNYDLRLETYPSRASCLPSAPSTNSSKTPSRYSIA